MNPKRSRLDPFAPLLAVCLACGAPAPQAEAKAGREERVRLGVEELLVRRADLIAGKRVGLVTHPAGVDGRLWPTVDLLARDGRCQLVQLWGPEHGIRGDAPAGDAVGDALDPATGARVQSLYGDRRRPTKDSLERVEVVLFDLQDVGSRTYTYVSTLGEVMIACAEAGVPLVVLDRPNPLGGIEFEGPVIEAEWKSFIGWGPTPLTHGLTIGEVARLFQAELQIGCRLEVVAMRGWERSMVWEDAGLVWTTTSPHVPHALQAHLYPATGMVAASTENVSDGVGSTMPFELIGGEFVDGRRLAAELEREGLAGVRFQPTAWKPFYGKLQGKRLGGVRLVLDDPRAFRPVRTALSILCALRRAYPEALRPANEAAWAKHWGNARVRALVLEGKPAPEVEASWKKDLEAFAARRERVLLYR